MMMSYQVTAMLCNAKRMTGIDFEIDPDLGPGEFVPLGDPDIEKFLVPPDATWDMTVFLVSMLRVTNSPWLSFLSIFPGIRTLVMILTARKVAKTLL